MGGTKKLLETKDLQAEVVPVWLTFTLYCQATGSIAEKQILKVMENGGFRWGEETLQNILGCNSIDIMGLARSRYGRPGRTHAEFVAVNVLSLNVRKRNPFKGVGKLLRAVEEAYVFEVCASSSRSSVLDSGLD